MIIDYLREDMKELIRMTPVNGVILMLKRRIVSNCFPNLPLLGLGNEE